MIPVNELLLKGNEAKYLAECIKTGWLSSDGPFVRELEERVAAVGEQRHGIAVMNGSVALDLAVAAMGIILPTFTIISCAAAVIRAGATPVVVDSEPVTWNMDPAQIELKITSRTKAIMVVHIYGLPVDMDLVVTIARRHGLKIIEDSAEQIGQIYKRNSTPRRIGSFGDLATFSFYANKHVTTGEGGMVLTSDDGSAQKCRSLRNLCYGKAHRFVHEELGWNFRMSNLQAAVGVAQMERLPEILKKKRLVGAWYNELLADVVCLDRLPPRTAYAENIYWVYGIVLNDSAPLDANRVMARLATKRHWDPPVFLADAQAAGVAQNGLFDSVSCPVAERIARRGFYIPSGVALTQDQAEQVSRALREVLSDTCADER
jgi:perosamine synthetase